MPQTSPPKRSRAHRMMTRKKTVTMFAWYTLPFEIRVMILNLLAQERRGKATYASVCKEWKDIIERRNFQRLKLRVSCLPDLDLMVGERRHLVRYIWLDIQLDLYDCPDCESPSVRQTAKDNEVVLKAVSRLFAILNTWDPTGDGLTLELNAISPSDKKHWFQYLCLESDEENKEEEDITSDVKLHDPRHNWVNGNRVKLPSYAAGSKVLQQVKMDEVKELLQVPAITTFVIRRHCLRQFPPWEVPYFLDRLPRLESIVYEPWRPLKFPIQYSSNPCETMMSRSVLRQLKRVSFFEHFNDDFHGPRPLVPLVLPPQIQMLLAQHQIPIPQADEDEEIGKETNHTIGEWCIHEVRRRMVRQTLNLEQFSMSFMLDAWGFFQAIQPVWTWRRLEFLALTSGRLNRHAYHPDISGLLEKAAIAARRMPRLTAMVLWNGGKGDACGFFYKREDKHCSITWRSLWDMELEPRVIEAWENVAARYSEHELRVEKELLDCSCEVNSYGDAIHHLKLPGGVIDPLSLYQIRKESRTLA